MLIQGLSSPVFPLKTIDVYMDGYYMDKDGNVWSTKGRSVAKMMGSSTPSGRYYTLNKRTHRADDLVRRARAHPDFPTQTSPKIVEESLRRDIPAYANSGRTTHAQNAVASKGFVLATMNPSGKLVFGTEPMYHLTDVTARAEAERVASLTGSEVVLLKIVGKVKVQKAVWE